MTGPIPEFSSTVNVPSSATNLFTVSPCASISGEVAFSGAGPSGVTVALSGSQSGSAMTDGSGQYRLLVAAGGNYTVTPSLAGYIFRPPDLNFDDLTGSQRASFEALQDQTITFGPLANQLLGAPPFMVSATASSGLPVSFASFNMAVCTVSSPTVVLVSVGICTIQATQTGNTSYAPATPLYRSFYVTPAPAFTTLLSFDGADGSNPVAGLAQAANGDLYGTTFDGGANAGYYGYGAGTVFKITPGGRLTTLYSFCSQSGCTDGELPYAGLVQATNGDFYGTTGFGGANAVPFSNDPNAGTVFRITPGGAPTTLYSFCAKANCADGQGPEAGLVQATNGDLYGTTAGGGANGVGGTIFRMTPNGAPTTLYSFCAKDRCTDGQFAASGLVQAANGDLYGTTVAGGANGSNGLGGTVFKIAPNGGAFTTLYSFCSQTNCTDRLFPQTALVQAADGDLYGTTGAGGANGCCGTVFKIAPNGDAFTTLYSFCSQSGCTDGSSPTSGLVQAADGDLYGTTQYGGANGSGTVFRIAPNGSAFATLYNFCSQGGCTDGEYPSAGLVQATNGDFYGTTENGGNVDASCQGGSCGTVFSLSVGLGPFVKTLPTSGSVGAALDILGTNLTGAMSVSFNGTAATFTVNPSGSAISTTVPAGATTGKIQVVTPSGTLSSNVNFQVLP
jgi:uncharacterized repeat protein (TIGR03803 family)